MELIKVEQPDSGKARSTQVHMMQMLNWFSQRRLLLPLPLLLR
jgi:hypothetical protein